MVVLHISIRLLCPLIVSHEALALVLLAQQLVPLHRIEAEEGDMRTVASSHRLDLVMKVSHDLILAREENVLEDLVENIGVGEEFGGLKSLLLSLPLIKEVEILITGLRKEGVLKGGVKNRLLLSGQRKIAGRGHGCWFARSVGGCRGLLDGGKLPYTPLHGIKFYQKKVFSFCSVLVFFCSFIFLFFYFFIFFTFMLLYTREKFLLTQKT